MRGAYRRSCKELEEHITGHLFNFFSFNTYVTSFDSFSSTIFGALNARTIECEGDYIWSKFTYQPIGFAENEIILVRDCLCLSFHMQRAKQLTFNCQG